MRRLLEGLKNQGKRIAAYGASAKGCMLLHAFDLGTNILEFVVDRNPAKQSFYMPGSHLPIFPTERLLESQPDYVLLLSWNFADEIIRQLKVYQYRGGKFIVPIPKPKVV